MATPSGTLTLTPHKHRLLVLDNDDSFLDDPAIHPFLAFFACSHCGHHFYIAKSLLMNHITGADMRPLHPTRGLFMRDQNDEWQLVFTVVS